MTPQKKTRLGKGLGALIGDYLEPGAPEVGGSTLPLTSIVPNPKQPRRNFNEVELAELAASIKENGLLQPLLVRPTTGNAGRFELVAGERRLRALRALGWQEAPVVIREVDDDILLVLALVENLQREALNPIEEAEGYSALSEAHGLTQGEIAVSVGKDRSTVANMLRLLKLPPSVRKLVEVGALSMGHARALLALSDPIRMADLAREAVKQGWSVREMERRTKTASEPTVARGPIRDPVSHALEEELRSVLGTKVLIRANRKGNRGVIEVPFHTAEEFERVFALVAGREVSEVVG
jgi:ParB family chromosome partitioning protein